MRALLALRSLFFVLLLPGMVAGYVPFRILRNTNRLRAPGVSLSSISAALLVVAGAAVLLTCVWDFFAAGHGTLAPIDPPRRLVVRGLYRFTRNPMYNGVAVMLAGWSWLFRSMALLEYAGIVVVFFHLFIVLYEEPTLHSRFGNTYEEYRHVVPRWGITLHPLPRNGGSEAEETTK